MSKKPLVSIITPSYNQAQFLDKTIHSVLQQDCPNFEYIICDGGSTDGSIDIIRKYESQLTWWCSENDNGQSDAINKGVARSKGEIIGWLNSDDLYYPSTISIVANYFDTHPEIGVIYGGMDRMDSDGRHIKRYVPRDYSFKDLLSCKLIIPQPSTFFRRSCFEDVGGLNIKFFHAMDFDLWVRLGFKCKIRRVESSLSKFRVHGDAKSVDKAYTVGPEVLEILDRVFSLKDLPDEIYSARKEIFSGAYHVAGIGYYASLQMGKARKCFLKSIQLKPSSMWQSNVLFLLPRTFLNKRWIRLIRLKRDKFRIANLKNYEP